MFFIRFYATTSLQIWSACLVWGLFSFFLHRTSFVSEEIHENGNVPFVHPLRSFFLLSVLSAQRHLLVVWRSSKTRKSRWIRRGKTRRPQLPRTSEKSHIMSNSLHESRATSLSMNTQVRWKPLDDVTKGTYTCRWPHLHLVVPQLHQIEQESETQYFSRRL